jgi:hypothetical protein
MNRSDDIKSNRSVNFAQNGEILKLISQGETDIRNEKAKPQQDVFEEIEKSLKEKIARAVK